jgi:hypothetical protein
MMGGCGMDSCFWRTPSPGSCRFFSFLFVLLEHYRLQLQHLSPHSNTQLAAFVHLCEMFVSVWPSVRLFCRFHVVRPLSKQPPRINGYFKYIAALTPGRWDNWWEDWLLM